MASVKKYNGSWRATVKRAGFRTLVSHDGPPKPDTGEDEYLTIDEEESEIAPVVPTNTIKFNKHIKIRQ